MTFRVGQKVVCVDDSGFNILFWNYPKKGPVYTVRELDTWSNGLPAIRLVEVDNPVGRSADGSMHCEPMFLARRFRPVVERKADISIFKEMLTPQGIEA